MRGLHSNSADCPRKRGRLWEYHFFGFTRILESEPPYLDFEEAHADALTTMQPILQAEHWDDKNPRPQPARQLLHAVKSFLIPTIGDELVLTPTIGTSFDFWHGVDFVISHPDIQQGPLVTVDICTAPKRQYKAEALLVRADFYPKLDMHAQFIAQLCWAKWKRATKLQT
ncbi:MAG: hypothetical protein RIQ72_105 [Candidatus Parcubacteria bacterium]